MGRSVTPHVCEELGGKLYLAGDGAVRNKETGYFTIMGSIDDVLNRFTAYLQACELKAKSLPLNAVKNPTTSLDIAGPTLMRKDGHQPGW